MTRLEVLTPGSRVEGLTANGVVTVLQAQWHGSGAVTLTYRDDAGNVGQELVHREDEPRAEDHLGRRLDGGFGFRY